MNLVSICCVTGTLSCWRGSQGEKPVRLAQVYIPNWLDYALGREHLDRFKIETYRLHPEIFCPPKKEDPNA